MVRVRPIAPITVGLTSADLVDVDALTQAGAVAFSNDGKGVQLAGTMYDAMRAAAAADRPIAAHAEDESLVRGGVINDGRRARELDLPPMTRLTETVQVARDVMIAEATGAQYHLCRTPVRIDRRCWRRVRADRRLVRPGHKSSRSEQADRMPAVRKRAAPAVRAAPGPVRHTAVRD